MHVSGQLWNEVQAWNQNEFLTFSVTLHAPCNMAYSGLLSRVRTPMVSSNPETSTGSERS